MSKYPGLACLTFALLLSISTGVTDAAEGQGVRRTFAVWGYGIEGLDFSDEDSVLVQVEKSDDAPNIVEGYGNVELEGTWISGPAMYITRSEGRTRIGSFYWLTDDDAPEPPPTGAVTLTGPGSGLTQKSVGYVYQSGGCSYPYGNELEHKYMIVVTAWFSR